jgi:glycosyltransferase involved in cell wall biosynthesis
VTREAGRAAPPAGARSPADAASISGLRVCRVATFPQSAAPGAGLAPYYLTRALGLETLYISRRGGGEPLEVPARTTLLLVEARTPRGAGKAGAGWLAIGRRLRDHGVAGFFLRSAGAMRRFRPELVHIHGLASAPHALFARAVLRAKVAITLHNSTEVRFFEKPVLRWLLGRFDLVFYMDEETHRALRRRYPEHRLAPTRTAADTEFFAAAGAPRARQLACVANLRWEKDLPTLLRAFARLVAEFPDYRLVIVGEGRERAALTGLRARLGLDASVELAGVQPRERVRELLQRSRAFVLSSVREGSPKVIHEAIACGTPVVATDAGGCRAAVGAAGIVVAPGDEAALAEALRTVARDDAAWEALHRECLAQRERLGWERVGEETLAHYARLFPGRAGARAPAPAPVVAGEALR